LEPNAHGIVAATGDSPNEMTPTNVRMIERFDFSCRGAVFPVGLFVPAGGNVPAEFELIFDYATRHCVTVWRALE
jgi:hypothetical protein